MLDRVVFGLVSRATGSTAARTRSLSAIIETKARPSAVRIFGVPMNGAK